MRTVVEGDAVYYGTGSGVPADDAPAIVFVHGAGFDHSVWVMPARYFARHGYRVVALDLPGHGRSEGAARTNIESMASWVVDLLDTLNIEKAAVVGHSMGSLVVMTLAAQHHERVQSLALLGTSAPMRVTNLLLDAASDNHHAAIDMANSWSHSVGGTRGTSETPGMSILNGGERLLERAADGVFHADLAACNEFSAQNLAAIAAPALVIAGDADKMTPSKAGLAVAEQLLDVRTCMLPGCGHAMLSEQPNAVLDALAAFILNEPDR